MTANRRFRLGDIADIEVGYAFKSSGFTKDGRGVKLLRGDNIAQGSTRWDRTEHWPKGTVIDPRYNLQVGDVVLAMDRPWIEGGLKFATLRADDLPAYLVQRVARLRAVGKNSQRYLACLIGGRDFTDYILSVQTGTSIPHISSRQIGDYPIEPHSFAEQHAIAEVLGALDDKIAANTRLAVTWDQFLAARFEFAVRLGAREVPLGEIARVNALNQKPVSGGELRYVDISSVSVGAYSYPEISSWEDAPSRARRGLRKGDTLWSTVRPNRRSHALNLSDDPLLVGSTGLAVLTPVRVGFAYLYEVTKLPQFTSYLETVAEGSAYPAVRAERFAEAPVPLLTPEAIEDFESLAAPAREHAHSLVEESRILVGTRDALLPQLMSGRLRVKDAEKLLEYAAV